MDQLLSYLGFGTLGLVLVLVALAIFAPAVLGVVGEFLRPVAGAVGRWLAQVIEDGLGYLWIGIKRFLADVFDDWVTVVGLAVCMYAAYSFSQLQVSFLTRQQDQIVRSCRAETATLKTELRKVRAQLGAAEKRLSTPKSGGWFQ